MNLRDLDKTQKKKKQFLNDKILSSEMWHRLVCKKFTDVSDERIASNFMVK
jgi:hypothetical protein